MHYILDTSALIEIENGNNEIVSSILELTGQNKVQMFVTYFGFCEYFYGHIRKDDKNRERVLERLAKYKLINTSRESAILFCNLRNKLKEEGKDIPMFDLLSASIAIANKMKIITMDRHFKQVPGLDVAVLNQKDFK